MHERILSTLTVLMDRPNAGVLINRKLPTEIFVEIFNSIRLEPCKRGTPGTSVWDPVIVHLDRLIRLSHVCRDWRNIIFNTGTLWDRIVDPRRHWKRAELAIRRAPCGTPLILSARNELSHLMRPLLNGERPIRELRYEGLTREIAENHFQTRMPSLESLSLTGRLDGNSSRRRSHLTWRRDHAVDPGIFSTHTPNLRFLALDSLPWIPMLQTTALTHLYLADCYGSHLLTRTLSLLSASPNLTDLVLVDGKDILLESLRDAHPRPIVMRKLRRLVCKCMSSSGVKLFLSHVQLSLETSLRLSEVRPLRRDVLDELSTLPSTSTINKLLITGIGTRFRVVGEGESAGIAIDHFVAENEDWGTALPRLLPMGQLRELHIVLRDSPALFASTPTALFDFLARAPALERLYLDTYALASVLDGLECYGRGSAPQKLACPNVALHVPVPCHSAPSNMHLIQLFATRQTKLGIRHLIAEHCPGCRGQPYRPLFPKDVQVNFASVKCVPKPRGAEHEWRMLRTNWPACEDLTYRGICPGGEDMYRLAFCHVAQ